MAIINKGARAFDGQIKALLPTLAMPVPNVANVGQDSMDVVWFAIAHATGYIVTQYSDAGFQNLISTTNTALLTLNFNGLNASTSDWFKVIATGAGYNNSLPGATNGTTAAIPVVIVYKRSIYAMATYDNQGVFVGFPASDAEIEAAINLVTPNYVDSPVGAVSVSINMLQFTTPGRYWYAEKRTQPMRNFTNDGTFDEAIGVNQTFSTPVIVGSYFLYEMANDGLLPFNPYIIKTV